MTSRSEDQLDYLDKAGGSGEPPAPLTPMQYRFMLALQKRLAANPDIGPTFEELKSDLGLASKSGVARLVASCIERGRISKLPNRDRSLVVLVPVKEDEISSGNLIKSFSDRELIAECQERGLIVVSSPE